MLGEDEQAIWNLLLASGYLKVKKSGAYTSGFGEWKQEYELELTNFEVKAMFRKMVRRWFGKAAYGYNDFIKALLTDDIKAMNIYMNKVAMNTFSYFDTGKNPSKEEPERFYHGFVLGLMVELADRYLITSNRESGFGRYDLVLEPRKQGNGTIIDVITNDAIIIEFKVQEAEEKDLSDQAALTSKGIPEERIRKYGFAFCGKKVLIGSANEGA